MQNNQSLVRRDLRALDASRLIEPSPYDLNAPGAGNDSLRFGVLLRRYRRQLLIIFSSFIVAALIVSKLTPVSFRSKVLLEVLAMNGEFLNTKTVDPTSELPSPDTYVETQTKLLATDDVIDRTVNVMAPTVPERLLNGTTLVDRVKTLLGSSPSEPRTGDEIVRSMLSRAKIKAEGQATLISVTLEGPDAKLTADTANAWIEQYQKQLQEARWSAANRTTEFLTQQLEGMRRKLQDSENALQTYARSTGLIYTDASHESIAADRLRTVQQDLARAEADLDDKQSQLELIKNSPVDALPKVFDDASLHDYKGRLAELQRQKADLLASFTPEHYKVQHIQSQIDQLRGEMEGERKTIVRRIENDYNAAKRRHELLAGSYHQQLGTVSDQSISQVRYNMLQQEVDASRGVYQAMLQRVKEASVVSALRASNLRVANAARAALFPSSPNLAINLGIAFLAAFMVSVLYILLRERGNQSIRMPGESIRLISVPELGVIPSTKELPRLARPRTNKILEPAGAASGEVAPASLPVAITSWHGNEPLVKESIRSLVTSLVMYGESFYRNRIILMTSPHPQAGKTTAVSNLGLALAESGRKVLIIDGDLRRPRLSSIFNVHNREGLAELLDCRQRTIAVEELIQETAYPNLFILPSGEAAEDLPRLLHSTRLEEILTQVRNQFDFILLDSPPMMALTDARLLSRNTDGVILVCRAGRTTGEQLAFSYRRLAEDGIEVIGTILNDWNPRSEDPSYFHSYADYAKSSRA